MILNQYSAISVNFLTEMPKPRTSPDKEVIKAFEAAGVIDYLQYLQSGKSLMWINFKAGVARGFGITVGATLVLGITIWILAKLVDLPIIGEYFEQAMLFINEYAENTNYSAEFTEMNGLLREIKENTER
jgi:uncharacterized membrane protein YagU involved in acid resistance